jgi:hypothetical protein
MSQWNTLRPGSAVLPLPFAAVLAALVASCSMTGTAKVEEKAEPAKALTAEQIERRIQAHGTPGVAHQILNGRGGGWSADVKLWSPGPGADEPVTLAATSEVKWTMDGLFLEDRTRSDFGKDTFKGLGFVGYDNLKERYVSTWIDNTGTSIHTFEGGYDPESRTFRFVGKSPDPATGKFLDVRATERMVDDDNWISESWVKLPSGEETKTLEITYKRAR